MRVNRFRKFKCRLNLRVTSCYIKNDATKQLRYGIKTLKITKRKSKSSHSSRRRSRKRHNPSKKNVAPPATKVRRFKTDNRSVNKLLYCLKSMEPTAQLYLWKEMIDHHPFSLDQLKVLKTAIDDRVRVDIISGVPFEIALYIMSFLSPRDLCQAAQTCKSWRTVCEDNRLWREKCQEEGLLDDQHTLDILFKNRISKSHAQQERFANETLVAVPKSEWKVAYLNHIDILRNWRIRKFEIKEPFIANNPIPVEQSQANNSNNNTNGNNNDNQVEAAALNGQLPARFIQRANAFRSRQVARRSVPPAIVAFERSQRAADNSVESNSSGDINAEPKEVAGAPVDRSSPTNDVDSQSGRLLKQLRCHEDMVITCLQFNPKTSTIVSGSDDQTLKVWSSETGRCINTLEGHTGGVWSSQLSPDDIVISGSTDRTLKVWNAHSGELIHTLYGHTSTVRCLALNGGKVVSGSRDTTLRLWDITQGTCGHVFLGHTAAVRCVEFKNDIIVSGAYDHLVMVWNAKTGSCIHALECHFSRIYSLQFDGKTIASGSLDSTICIWDATAGKLRHCLEGHQSLTSKMQLKGNLLVSANADSYCKVWDINTGVCLQTLTGENKHTSAITSVFFNNRHVVTSSDDGTVKLWDIKTGEFIRNLIVLPSASKGGVVWRIRASYTKLICAVGSRTQTEDTHLLVLDFNG